jgi:hypothetical protein
MVLASVLYAASFCAVWFSANCQLLNFWMLGVLLAGFFIPKELAIALQIILTISYCMINELPVETFICYFTFGTLILLLEEFLDRLQNIIAILIIGVTTNIAFLILLQDFELAMSADVVLELVSTAVTILCLWGIHIYFDPVKKMKKKSASLLEESLMDQLNEYSKTIYRHSLYVGEVSREAAKQIGANEEIAYKGGCYHEIGRMRGKDYIACGVEILTEAGVSKEVVDVVKEHNIHKDKPTSKEAAIVMLADSIITTIRYLRTKEPDNKVTMEVVVKSIFKKRREMEMFVQTGLSEQELEQLQQYFIETFKEK